MTRRDVGKPAFSLRKKRFVKTHALSLLGTTRLLSRSEGLALLPTIMVIIQTPWLKEAPAQKIPPVFDELPPPNKSKGTVGEHGRFQ